MLFRSQGLPFCEREHFWQRENQNDLANKRNNVGCLLLFYSLPLGLLWMILPESLSSRIVLGNPRRLPVQTQWISKCERRIKRVSICVKPSNDAERIGSCKSAGLRRIKPRSHELQPVPLVHHAEFADELERVRNRLGLRERESERVVGVGVGYRAGRAGQFAGVADGGEGVEGRVARGVGAREQAEAVFVAGDEAAAPSYSAATLPKPAAS